MISTVILLTQTYYGVCILYKHGGYDGMSSLLEDLDAHFLITSLPTAGTHLSISSTYPYLPMLDPKELES